MNNAQHINHLPYLAPDPDKEGAYKVSMSTGQEFWRKSGIDTKKGKKSLLLRYAHI